MPRHDLPRSPERPFESGWRAWTPDQTDNTSEALVREVSWVGGGLSLLLWAGMTLLALQQAL